MYTQPEHFLLCQEYLVRRYSVVCCYGYMSPLVQFVLLSQPIACIVSSSGLVAFVAERQPHSCCGLSFFFVLQVRAIRAGHNTLWGAISLMGTASSVTDRLIKQVCPAQLSFERSFTANYKLDKNLHILRVLTPHHTYTITHVCVHTLLTKLPNCAPLFSLSLSTDTSQKESPPSNLKSPPIEYSLLTPALARFYFIFQNVSCGT